jgi:hypothetical protein
LHNDVVPLLPRCGLAQLEDDFEIVFHDYRGGGASDHADAPTYTLRRNAGNDCGWCSRGHPRSAITVDICSNNSSRSAGVRDCRHGSVARSTESKYVAAIHNRRPGSEAR